MSNESGKRVCSIGDNEIAYTREGVGETVLLVHGITTYSFIWKEIASLLSRTYDVINVDLLGCGDSSKPLDVPYSIKNHSKILHQFVNELGIEKFHYIGHDLGGGIGQIFAVNYAELLYDLTLVNSVAYDFWPVQPIIALKTPIIRQLIIASLDFGTYKLLVKRGLYHKDRVTPELMDLYWKPMKTKEGRKAFLHFADNLNNEDLLEISESLKKIDFPVLIIRGDADVYLSSEISDKLHNEIPNSQLVTIPTAGHYMQIDEPEQLFEHLNTFLGRGNDTR